MDFQNLLKAILSNLIVKKVFSPARLPLKTRSKRIAGLIAGQVSHVLTSELNDPRLSSIITVTHVIVKDDLRNATIFISVLDNNGNEVSILRALNSAKGYIRKELGSRLELKYVPEISFKIDSSVPEGNSVLSMLDANLNPNEKSN